MSNRHMEHLDASGTSAPTPHLHIGCISFTKDSLPQVRTPGSLRYLKSLVEEKKYLSYPFWTQGKQNGISRGNVGAVTTKFKTTKLTSFLLSLEKTPKLRLCL